MSKEKLIIAYDQLVFSFLLFFDNLEYSEDVLRKFYQYKRDFEPIIIHINKTAKRVFITALYSIFSFQ